jgi:hypothetical protein
MSYIKQKFSMENNNQAITELLIEEGFKADSWNSEKCMQFVTSVRAYSVWVMVYSNRVDYFVEYECGGRVASGSSNFDNSDFDDFLEVYKETVDNLTYWVED